MVKFPDMRKRLLLTIRILTDIHYQRRAWVEHRLPVGCGDDFDETVHCLYDDLDFKRDPQRTIGAFVENEEELALVLSIMHAIDRVFEELGLEATDEEYISCERWPEVVEAARKAWDKMGHDLGDWGARLFQE